MIQKIQPWDTIVEPASRGPKSEPSPIKITGRHRQVGLRWGWCIHLGGRGWRDADATSGPRAQENDSVRDDGIRMDGQDESGIEEEKNEIGDKEHEKR